ncbi:GNAT family N-acetyltransferase [Phenylobacterium sp.]|jgi:GNAT superfamily N-acetyltransferase|uniref:GNAT family N-acetyltransferase n=1 Tax=Phenylobacterium sp. TaxID=1871053 RepID=UPI002E34672F|nr:GNAT family N-acetyltransferase [Phenylobacterium sp.]HEX2560342.1 GNAT family N-acetyltransferase [Phenylobacterium sp.]
MAELTLEPTSQQGLAAVAALMRRAFPQAGKYTEAYLNWLYFQNPVGPALAFDVREGERVVSHGAGILQRLVLHGRPVLGALMLNTATDADRQGRGLFSQVVTAVIEEGRRRGVAALIGVANQNSVGPYVKRLGFHDVRGLDAFVSVAPERIDVSRALAHADLRRDWDDAALAWRMGNPEGRLKVVAVGADALVVEGASTAPLVAARAVIPRRGLSAPEAPRSRLRPAVSLALAPAGASRRGVSLTVPDRLRPSPLRLIYFNLEDPADRLDPDRILFSFLDFDAF